MNIGKSYRLAEFILWTRRNIYILLILAAVPVALYQLLGLKWLALPWPVVAFLGTAASIIVAFKNTQTYSRTVEAQQVWVALAGSSRYWGLMSRDFLHNPEKTKELIYRHFAWLTALRYQIRGKNRVWESIGRTYNAEYSKHYTVPEKETALAVELEKYLAPDVLADILNTRNKTTQFLSRQSETLKSLFQNNEITINVFLEMEKLLKELCDQQAKIERIKNFPYPRQYAVINAIFVWVFCLLIPLGMIGQFDALNGSVTGFMKGHMVWLVIPCSVVIGWLYTSLEQVGESTANPFEGNANDVPIAQICRSVEIELREFLGEKDLPKLLKPENGIVM